MVGKYSELRDGLRTYYSEQGEGDPVVLLHGGGVNSDSWYFQIPALAEHYRVPAPEARGHGRTADVEGPMTFEALASDTVDFLEALDLGPAHLIGWSAGGTVALRTALRRPDLVHKLVVMEAGTNPAGPSDAELLDDAEHQVPTAANSRLPAFSSPVIASRPSSTASASARPTPRMRAKVPGSQSMTASARSCGSPRPMPTS